LEGSGFNLVDGASVSGLTVGASGASGVFVVGFILSGTDGFVDGGLVVGRSGGFELIGFTLPGLKPGISTLNDGRLNLPILYYFHLFFIGIKYKCLPVQLSNLRRHKQLVWLFPSR
jgi:hypothetical protein